MQHVSAKIIIFVLQIFLSARLLIFNNSSHLHVYLVYTFIQYQGVGLFCAIIPYEITLWSDPISAEVVLSITHFFSRNYKGISWTRNFRLSHHLLKEPASAIESFSFSNEANMYTNPGVYLSFWLLKVQQYTLWRKSMEGPNTKKMTIFEEKKIVT